MNKRDLVLKHLKEYGSITPMDALFKFGLYRLGGRIFELREKGFNIETILTKQGKDTHCKYLLRADK